MRHLCGTPSLSARPRTTEAQPLSCVTASLGFQHLQPAAFLRPCKHVALDLGVSQVHHALAEMLTSILQPNLKTDQPRSLARSLSPHILQVGTCLPLHLLFFLKQAR